MTRILEWTLATAGALICVAGATAIAAQQQQMSVAGESLWPLPGLVLAEWLLLGLASLAGIVLDR
ncbi:MAG: hypothetical protein EXR62_03620 [Chloroflexi bacterium]|nr:hypothetical protein [Chloroflexota bacterium]